LKEGQAEGGHQKQYGQEMPAKLGQPLTLSLFMLGICADYPYPSLSFNNLAFLADFLYRASYLHSL